MEIPILSLLVALPLIGAIVLSLFPKESSGLIRKMALSVAMVVLLVSLLLLSYDGGASLGLKPLTEGLEGIRMVYPTMQFVMRFEWLSSLGVSLLFGIDGMSLWLVLLASFLTPLVILSASARLIDEHVKPFMVGVLVVEAGALGVLVSLDGVMFLLFWEMTLFPLYFLLGMFGGKARNFTAIKTVVYGLFGSALMLIGMMYMSGKTGAIPGGYSFGFDALAQVPKSGTEQIVLFVLFAVGFGIKAALFPFHTWLANVGEQAKTSVSVLVSGLVVSLGSYGLMRLGLPLFPEGMATVAPVLGVLSVISITYGAIVALVQKDLRKLAVYMTVSHLGFCVLGLASMTTMGIMGAIYVTVANGLSTAGLLFCLGILKGRGASMDIESIKGLGQGSPKLKWLMVGLFMMGAGVPGFVSFVGELLVIVGASQSTVMHVADWALLWFEGSNGPLALEVTALVISSVAALGMVFGGAALMWMYQRAMSGTAAEGESQMTALTRGEITLLASLLVVGLLLGVFPNVMMSKSHNTVQEMVRQPAVIMGINARTTEAQRDAFMKGKVLKAPPKEARRTAPVVMPKKFGKMLGVPKVPNMNKKMLKLRQQKEGR